MMHQIVIKSLFGKPVTIEEAETGYHLNEALDVTIGDRPWDRYKVQLQWDDVEGAYFIQYVNTKGVLKRERLGLEMHHEHQR